MTIDEETLHELLKQHSKLMHRLGYMEAIVEFAVIDNIELTEESREAITAVFYEGRVS